MANKTLGSDVPMNFVDQDGLGLRYAMPMSAGPITGTALASAARTTTATSADLVNPSARGVLVFLSVTVVGTGSVTLTINGKDPVSGTAYAILTGAAVTTNVLVVYRIYPGLTAAANATASDVLPATWNVVLTSNNANAVTASVGYALIP